MPTSGKILAGLSYVLYLVCLFFFGYSFGTMVQHGFDEVSFGVFVLSLFFGINFGMIFYDVLDYYGRFDDV